MSNWRIWTTYKDEGPWNFTEQPDKYGYLNNSRWSSQQDAQEFCKDMGISLDPTHTHRPCGHWHKITEEVESISGEDGKFYCCHPAEGPVYYPASYKITEIDVDSMSVSQEFTLPTISGYALEPLQMTITNTNLYAICQIANPGWSGSPYLLTMNRNPLEIVSYTSLPDTSSGGVTIEPEITGFDIGISSSGYLFVYVYGNEKQSPYDPFAIYRKYNIGSDGIPVQSGEVLQRDHDYYETGMYRGTALIPGSNYAFVGMQTDMGRLVKLQTNPFSRAAIYDANDDIDNKLAQCYGTCYDIDNEFVYMLIDYYDAAPYQKIFKVNASTMSLVSTLTLSSATYGSVSAICDHPDNGFIYAQTYNSITKVMKLYEVNLSTFSVSRSATIVGCTQNCNGLYTDSERGYIYYCGYGTSDSEFRFYRFDLTSFADSSNILIADPALVWGINTAQAYHKTGFNISGYSATTLDEPQVWTMNF